MPVRAEPGPQEMKPDVPVRNWVALEQCRHDLAALGDLPGIQDAGYDQVALVPEGGSLLVTDLDHGQLADQPEAGQSQPDN